MNTDNRPLGEDNFHVLQQPRPTSADDPFVGNESLDENLAETAQLAAWQAVEGHCDCLAATASAGCVTLTGTVDSKVQSERCEAVVRSVKGVRDVVNRLIWPAGTIPGRHGLDPASPPRSPSAPSNNGDVL